MSPSPPPIGRIGLVGALVESGKRDIEARACNLLAGDLYSYPKSTDTINGSQPLTFKWRTDCSMSSTIDLYLYAPSAKKAFVQGWSGVDYSKGEYTTDLKPSWWNNTDSAQMYLAILESGAQSWDTKSPSGPVFKVSYDASQLYATTTVNGQVTTSAKTATVTNGGDAIMQNVSNTNSSKGISKGAIAAAVVVPLLVIAILALVGIRFWRAREAEKRRRWSAAVSQHSNLEWEKGANPGEKPASILGRPSTHYSFRPGSMATSSVYAVENNMAGAGAGGFPRPSFQLRSYSAENVNASRSSVVLPDGQVRQSRISFAEAARPDRRSRLSLGDNLRPNIGRLAGGSRSANDLVTPAKKAAYATGSAIADDEDDINISPSQLQGPHSFADAEMKRVGQGKRTGRRSMMSLGSRRNSTTSVVSADDFKSAASARGSVDELRDMEAVMLMRRSMISQHSKGSPNPEAQFEHDQVEALDNEPVVHDMPAVPAPAAQGTSTVAYGPDQMLAVYAARGKVSATAMPPLPSPGMRSIGAPAPGDMRSYVHLNTGTVSSAAIGALPPPGPPTPVGSSLTVPTLGSQGRTTARMSGASDNSQYSEEGSVGEAK